MRPTAKTAILTTKPKPPRPSELESIADILARVIASHGCDSELRQAAARSLSDRAEKSESKPSCQP
jgi:MarR-like DNA-binding transcriptional regulator SgrR of sgrS sRNA